MLSLKRKSDAQPAAAPRWHANFRNFERLPDTKVVRTAFFINTAAVAIALGALLWLGYQEYTILSIQDQIALAEADIEANKKQNEEATRLSRQFAEQIKKIDEAATFGLDEILATADLHDATSGVVILVVPADEERQIALEAQAVMAGEGA